MSELWASLPDLTACIGKEKAEELCRKYGGRSLYVPAKPKRASALARIVDPQSMEKLVARFGGYHLSLPNLRRPEAAKAKAMELLAKGLSHAEISAECGISERWVRTLAARMRAMK